jgi:hypothetical protein
MDSLKLRHFRKLHSSTKSFFAALPQEFLRRVAAYNQQLAHKTLDTPDMPVNRAKNKNLGHTPGVFVLAVNNSNG